MSRATALASTGRRDPARPVAASNQRNADLAAIHIAKGALGLSEDEYRDLMATVCGGVRSSAQLDISGRQRFRAHLEACLRAHGIGQAGRQRPQRRALTPHEGKMWSLWMELADAGLVVSRTMKALQKFAKRQTGVDATAFLNHQQATLVIESLKLWLDRRQEPKA